jgi:hypothetical protein
MFYRHRELHVGVSQALFLCCLGDQVRRSPLFTRVFLPSPCARYRIGREPAPCPYGGPEVLRNPTHPFAQELL